MTEGTVALTLAAFFTFGCITIYESRQHARAMTSALGVIAVCLGLLVGLMTLAGQQPVESGRAATVSPTGSAPRADVPAPRR